MPINILFAAHPKRWIEYESHLRDAFSSVSLDVHLSNDMPPEIVDYIIYAPNGSLRDFTPFTQCKAVLSLWAGVESIVENETLTQPLCRMVDPSLTQGMVEWVTGHVLRHHLGTDSHVLAKPGEWLPVTPPVAWDRKITVLGLGELGSACARMLASLGFQTHGWARTKRTLDGVACHTGTDGLRNALQDANGIVMLLPATRATENVLNSERLSHLASGAFVLNPGRGPLIDDDALINTLNTGQVEHATLDVFRTEPLPQDHPFWHHPRVTITPHIASETRPKWASKSIANNVLRGESNLGLQHIVNRDLGY